MKNMKKLFCMLTLALLSLTLLAGGFGYAIDSAAQNKDNIQSTAAAQASYQGSAWQEGGVSFEQFLNYYSYYGAAYDQHAEEYAQMGYTLGGMGSGFCNSREELMDALYMQYAMYSYYDTSVEGEE